MRVEKLLCRRVVLKQMKRSGFTLIEVLIVVSIIALLIVAGMFSIYPSLSKGKDGRRKADLHQIANALEDYFNDHNSYPSTDSFNDCGANTVLKNALKSVPCDPIHKTAYKYLAEPSGCSPSGTACTSYRLFASLDNNSDPDKTKLGCTVDLGGSKKGCYKDDSGIIYDYGVAVGRTVSGTPTTGP